MRRSHPFVGCRGQHRAAIQAGSSKTEVLKTPVESLTAVLFWWQSADWSFSYPTSSLGKEGEKIPAPEAPTHPTDTHGDSTGSPSHHHTPGDPRERIGNTTPTVLHCAVLLNRRQEYLLKAFSVFLINFLCILPYPTAFVEGKTSLVIPRKDVFWHFLLSPLLSKHTSAFLTPALLVPGQPA